VLGGSRGFSIGLNVKTAFLKAADTAGTNAYTTYGENVSFSNKYMDTSFALIK